jgi:hypothetical protein
MKNKLLLIIKISLLSLISKNIIAEDWQFHSLDNVTNGYSETRLSSTSNDLKTSLNLICNKYGVQLLITATGWKPAFYENNVSWLGDIDQGGVLNLNPTDSTAGLQGEWHELTEREPEMLLNAINSNNSITFMFKIYGKIEYKKLNTKAAHINAKKFLDSCLF